MMESTQADPRVSRTSASLIGGVQRGDKLARARFHEKYAPLMYGWCRNRWNLKHHDAEDLTADLTVKLLLRLQDFQYDSGKSFRVWLHVVVKNAVADFWRANARMKLDGGVRLELLTSDDDLSGHVEEALLLLEAKERVREKSNPTHWNIFSLLCEKGYKPVDVAKLLGVTRNVVDNAKLRVKKALKEELISLDGLDGFDQADSR